MSTIEFVVEVPAATGNRASTWGRDTAAALRARPNEWAFIGRKSQGVAHQIRSGTTKAFQPAGSFEAVARNSDGRKADIYARFVGEGGSQ